MRVFCFFALYLTGSYLSFAEDTSSFAARPEIARLHLEMSPQEIKTVMGQPPFPAMIGGPNGQQWDTWQYRLFSVTFIHGKVVDLYWTGKQ